MVKELSVVLTGEDQRISHVLDELRKVKLVPLHLEVVAFSNLRETLGRLHPQLIIYDSNGDIEQVGRSAAEMSHEFSDVPWAVASSQADVDTVLRLFRMGAIDFLKEPIRTHDVKRLVQHVLNLENGREHQGKEGGHQSIAVFSTKGGVGSTMIATNLAVECARQNRNMESLLLIDLVLQHGNVADVLDVPPRYTLLNLMENFERVDSNLLENSVVRHASGCYVLPCTKQPEDAESVMTSPVSDVFQFLRGSFQCLIADVGHEFSKTTVSFLDLADLVLVIANPDVPSLRNTQSTLATLKQLGYSADKVKVVLNRWRQRGGIDGGMVEKTLSIKLFHRIPDDPLTCLSALNQGKPISDVAKRSDLAKSMQQLASSVGEIIWKGADHVAS